VKIVEDNNSKLLQKYQRVLELLTEHAKENGCTHKISDLLEEVNFDFDE
jgi:hypothetical protein